MLSGSAQAPRDSKQHDRANNRCQYATYRDPAAARIARKTQNPVPADRAGYADGDIRDALSPRTAERITDNHSGRNAEAFLDTRSDAAR